MIPVDCKRLAEVDFPIAAVSRHSAREKSIRHGHPSTLHLWWARRPLAACRAMLLALLLPDPADPACPSEFKIQARELLSRLPGRPAITDLDLRHAILKFIGDFANWDLAANAQYLAVGRGLVKAAHPEDTPLVADPFAGGGSIPLEALRLGCDAFASDLNPVAGLIQKVMLEDIPRHGPGLADELRRAGTEIKAAAEKELAEFYPPDPDGATPIAYLWARTVRCESPDCGAEIPLVRSFWLSKKANRRRALRPKVEKKKGQTPAVEFEIFEPAGEKDVPAGTVSRAKATCLCCSTVLPPERVRAQLREQRGGADVIFDNHMKRTGGARLLATVTLKQSEIGRKYRLPTESDYGALWRSRQKFEKAMDQLKPNGQNPVPDEPLPFMSGVFNVPLYGMNTWRDLYTVRQCHALVTLSRLIGQVNEQSASKNLLAMVLSRVSSRGSSLCLWRYHADQEKVEHVFGRQALPMVWDFAEAVPLSDATGSFSDGVAVVAQAVEALSSVFAKSGQAELADALHSPLPDETTSVWFTDPPYYFAVPYADLSDYFFIWLKRTLPDNKLILAAKEPGNPLTPKSQELCEMAHWDPDRYSNKNQRFFEDGMSAAFGEGRRVLREDGIGTVVFAHKTTEGWEALLSGMTRGGWVITASWPIATEMANRLRARESAALATSVHLVCRPRTTDETGDWSMVLRELPRRVAEWMERLEAEGVRGADLVFACIGPALEIYSRYAKVLDAEDREIPLGGDPTATEPYKRGYLAYVWETVARAALEQVLGTAEARARNGAAGALEEDARLTALFLWTLQSTEAEAGPRPEQPDDEEDANAETETDDEDEEPRKKAKGFSLIYDVARRFAQPLGIHLEDWEGRIIATEKGAVRLLPVAERARQLFGEDGAEAVAAQLEQEPGRAASLQMTLLPEMETPAVKGRKAAGRRKAAKDVTDEALQAHREATTLDRVHAAMLLQRSGRANALRALLKAEQERGPNFLRLANSLSALYPRDSEEKRLVDAMLLAMPR